MRMARDENNGENYLAMAVMLGDEKGKNGGRAAKEIHEHRG